MPDSIARRIVEGVRWRADAIYSRVPRKARVWLEWATSRLDLQSEARAKA